MSKISLFLVSILAVLSFNCSEQVSDTHSAFWIESNADSLQTISVFQFFKDGKKDAGNMIILNRNVSETVYKMENLAIKNNKHIIFNVAELELTFEGDISDDGFYMNGKFLYKNGTSKNYGAKKVMDETYIEFKNNYLKGNN